MASKNVKKRNWAFVLYPESAPRDWQEQLQQTGLPCVISPLHDRDTNADGSPKKAHYHVILCYAGPTSYNVVRALTEHLRQPIPQALEQVRGYYRYLTHADNPEKAQYDEREIVRINGFDIRDFVELTKTEVDRIKAAVLDYIEDNDITEYIDLLTICRADDMPQDWFGVVAGNTMLFTAALASRRYKQQAQRREQERGVGR